MGRSRTATKRRSRALTKAAPAGGIMALPASPAVAVRRPFGLLEALNAATNHGMPPGFQPMPRDPNDLGAFGPGQPIRPEPIDPLDPRTGRPEPRVWEYPQSWNLPGNNRREVPWQVLRAAASGVDIIRRCIEVRKAHVADLQWSWSVRASVVEKAYNTSRDKGYDAIAAELREKHQADIERLTARWEQPWPHQDWSFDQWVRSILEEILVIDAGVVYPRMSLAGEVLDLEQVDGSTIKPLLDHRGIRPAPPFPAYQQEVMGFPRGEWAASTTLDAEGNAVIDNGYASSEMFYFRSNPRVTSPYGLSAVEQSLISARLYLKRQGWMLAEYEDGSTPLTWIETPENPGQEMKPQDRRIWEESVNAEYAGNAAARHRMKVGAPGWKIQQMTSADERYKPDFDLFLVKLVAGHFGVTATELGFSETTGLGGTGWQEGQAEVGGRVGLRPDVKALTGLINGVSRQFLNAPPEIEFSFIDPASENDKDSDGVADAQLKRAVITINDDRRRLKLPLFSFPEADMPMLVGVGASGYVFVEGAKAAADAAAEAAVKAQEAAAEGQTGKLEVENRKIDEDAKARKEEHAFQRENRDAEQEFQREQAETTTKAVTSELHAFATWHKRHGDNPKRPFVFKAATPDDFDDPPGPAVADFGDEWLWVTDDMIEKRAKSGLDWKAWNALHPTKPKDAKGRWVKVGTVLGEALDAAAKVEPFSGIDTPAKATSNRLADDTHDALVKLGETAAEYQRENKIYPLLADKLGISRGVTTRLERGGYVKRSHNMLGDSVKITDKGHDYLMGHRGTAERDAELAVQQQALLDQAAQAHEDAAKARREGGMYSGEIARLAGIEARAAEARAESVRQERVKLRGDAPAPEPVATEEPKASPVPQSLSDFRTMAADFNAEVFNAHEFGETWTAAIKGGDDDGPLRWATRDQSGQWTDHRGVRIADEDVPAHLEEMYAQRADLRDKRNAYFRSKRPGGPRPAPEYAITRRRDRFTVMGPDGELHEASTRREADAWLKAEKARRATAEEPDVSKATEIKIPTREGKARRGDVMVVEEKTHDYVIGEGSKERTEYKVYEVTSVSREGEPLKVRDLQWLTGERGVKIGNRMDRAFSGRRQIIPGDQLDVAGLSAALNARTYPNSTTPMAHDSLAELRDAIRPHLAESGASPSPAPPDPGKEWAAVLKRIQGAGDMDAQVRQVNAELAKPLTSETRQKLEEIRARNAERFAAITKAAEGGDTPKAEAPVDERWPGWAQDLAIAAGTAAALAAALAAGAAAWATVRGLADAFAGWAQGWRGADARPDVLGWLRASTDLGPQIERDIRQPIEDAWAEAYMVGTRSARAVTENLAAGIPPREAGVVEVDWAGWTPGDISAARRIMTADGSIEPWLDLLRDAGITIKRIADNRLQEVARCLADGLDRGASVDEIARDLQRTIADPKWCYKVAVTETNRALSAATLDTYELAGVGASEWMTALDQRVCKRCKANENQGPVRLGERYPSGDYHPPGHPHCRCALVPSMAALDSLLIVKRAKSGLDWIAWNVQHPTKMKDSKGRWSRGNGASLADADPLRTVDGSTNRVVDSSTMRRKSYFRVQSGSRDVNDLLKPEEQTSSAWHHHHLDNPETTRRGVSVTESRESLAQYLATTGAGIPYGEEGWLLVELEGDISDDRPLDFEDGEHLIHPTRIVSAQPIPDDFFEMIGNAYDARTDGGW